MATVRVSLFWGLALGACLGLTGCQGGGDSGPAADSSAGTADGGCTGFCASTSTFLTQADVGNVIARAVAEAQARGVNATIAVSDRIGNVLGVFQMTGAAATATITAGRTPAVIAPASGATLEGVTPASTLAAVSKAITGAYLSSEGNAFTTRTANQIVQENFNPGESNRPSGPLFGVQFSQLACSDLVNGANIAPKASPLGLSADPGGLPLYKNGTPVGGIGVISDGVYGLDLIISDIDRTGVASNDEAIALAGTFGFAAPTNREANRITVDGKTFRFTDVLSENLRSDPAAAASFTSINGTVGNLADAGVTANATVFFNAAGGLVEGTAWGQASGTVPANRFSGIVPANTAVAFTGQSTFQARDAFVLTNAANTNTYPPVAGTALTQAEVLQIMASALDVANSARAQIRRPVNSQARVTISIVDTNGAILGVVRTRDAPMFGTDVSLQKARTAVLFSSADAATALGTTANNALDAANSAVNLTAGTLSDRVTTVRNFLGDPNALTGTKAFADRSGGNLARPFFPDGVSSTSPGPLSNPFAQWSPFATGLQLELVFEELGEALFSAGGPNASCGAISTLGARVGNGIQIFPGSVPIYRGSTLVGGIGVSGDGIDQDDMISFLGLHNAGVILGTGVGNAPAGIRADTITVSGVNLRYIQCPQAPFLNSSQQNVCQGK